MQIGSMFISNCNNTLHVSNAFCVHPQEHLKTVVTSILAVTNKHIAKLHHVDSLYILNFVTPDKNGVNKQFYKCHFNLVN